MAEASPASKYLAEFIGTSALVFSVGLNVLNPNPSIFGVVAIASTLMVMIYALGGISGGHFNPAVSLAVKLAKDDFGWDQFGIYTAIQLLAGAVGAFSYVAVYGGNTFNLKPVGNYNWYDAAICEVLYTFMLVFTVLNVAVAKKSANNEYFGIAIAFTVVAGGYGAGAVSGGCFNPAVAFGIDISSAWLGFGHCLYYWVAEFIGGALAYAAYLLVRPEESGQAENTASKLASEFIGTFFLVLTVGFNVNAGPKAAVFSIAASLMCMIYALGNVSGGHFNPAVTIAILAAARDKISVGDACLYILAQLAGGIVAGVTYSGVARSFAITQPSGGWRWDSVFAAEFVFTFVLAYTVLCVATTRAALAHFFALAIGFCVIVGGYSIGNISGGHLNPAVSMGIDASSAMFGGTSFYKCFIYGGMQIAGGLAAAGTFSLTHASEYGKGMPQPKEV